MQSTMNIYDSHTHLNTDPLFEDWEWYLQKFIDIGGVGLVNSWANESYNRKGIEITRQAEILKQKAQNKNSELIIRSTIWYHPGCCDDGEISEKNIQQKMIELKNLYHENKEFIVAIWECGIDTYFPGSEDSLPLQKNLFALQCDLAKELHLPLMIHIRKDFDTAFEVLQNYRDLTIYVHCRGFGPKEVEMLKRGSVELWWNLFIGFCGNVTYKNAHNLRDSLTKVPIDCLLLETDAPRLSPQVVRGTINHPANVKYIYDFIAEYLKIDLEKFALQIEKNFNAVYGL